MYQYIKGTIDEIGEDYIVIANNDIGYKIYTSTNTIAGIGNEYNNRKIYTHLYVREDEMTLYGFLSKDELNMFKLLLTVSKIGPKVALGLLSTLSSANIKIAIINEDTKALSKAPGIGKKTAERLILELKDKISDNIVEDVQFGQPTIKNDFNEAVNALLALGYTKNEVNTVLSKNKLDGYTTEDIIKIALKELSKR
ncbi:Holliday junction branch migration protein RuvA [Thermohalobacter berrensis]|uniref:Holliday junction branch migration complex subunit RuvA n=1 Tax=Thermohalobacter berrensis TaxID=99594 RepID=A0A419TAZ5_9FIRM|nr:Holliday junction branch migration protein RuvA [Thermohalobacter berrensis]RKD34664.1 Holliday junction DNA helicase RuvA [Thermohalobacter berrensis]